ncbi:energy-coupling factor transporter transmembrane protein EcfT [Brachybacterium sp. UMB0905]|uniref:energy-coupling factor transporter transmembrane component T family protein n=1 Tax=Brachybacterium sp. UMB0905 TaxID=2069310 RepID=UPI000C805122|nr:energy-coupling factor transporter transmembrane component T [Brachybacterium sp. UMB0905]PMC75608.1 hypothetical protein CJ197_07675 [Brachybacterium sp. UMB0905]
MSTPLLGYVDRPGVLHGLSGTTKLIVVLAVILSAVISSDLRLLTGLALLSAIAWALSRVRLADLKVVLSFITVFMVLNSVAIFLFAPGYGEELFASRHLLWDGPWHWDLTAEQLVYQAGVAMKYLAVLPGVLLFITTTRPPEFASSLARIGVPYRFAYAVSLALRYIPDIQREYRIISSAQQARGLDLSRRAGLGRRLRNLAGVLLPLLLGAVERIDRVSAAMELRGFGRGRGRTWLITRPLRGRDIAVILGAIALVAGTVAMVAVTGERFWDPWG